VEEEEEEEDDAADVLPPPLIARTPEEKRRLLIAAIKPPIYTVALIPVLVRASGGRAKTQYLSGVVRRERGFDASRNRRAPLPQVGFAAAYYDTGAFVASALGAYTACACLVIAWLNLSNDAWVRGVRASCLHARVANARCRCQRPGC
jgi:hypothetical protein